MKKTSKEVKAQEAIVEELVVLEPQETEADKLIAELAADMVNKQEAKAAKHVDMKPFPTPTTPKHIAEFFHLDQKVVRRHLRKILADSHVMKSNWQFTHDSTLQSTLDYFSQKYPNQAAK